MRSSTTGRNKTTSRVAEVVRSYLALIVLAACSSEGSTPPSDAGTEAATDAPITSTCPTGVLGDPSRPIQIELRVLGVDGVDKPIVEGGDLPLIFPPQGGRVSFVGVRATNLDGCEIQLTAALRDIATGQIMLDARTQNLERESDGWGTSGRGTTTNLEDSSALGDYSNIPICPNQWASVDIFDQPFELVVKIQDRFERTATQTIRTTPRCAEPGAREAACKCICKHGYTLGEPCGEVVDAGTP